MAKKETKIEVTKIEETKIEAPKSADISYMCMGIKFDTMDEFIAIMKNNHEQTKQDWLDDFIIHTMDHEPQYQKFITKMTEEELFAKIDSIPAITVAEAFTKYHGNSEQLMRVLSFLDPEEIVKGVDAKLIDEEVLTKTQPRTVFKSNFDKNDMSKEFDENDFETKEVTYEDRYSLYKIEGKKLHLDSDAYIVGCKCTTTGKDYYLFIEEENAVSAIGAIASTLKNEDGSRMNRDQYLQSLETES